MKDLVDCTSCLEWRQHYVYPIWIWCSQENIWIGLSQVKMANLILVGLPINRLNCYIIYIVHVIDILNYDMHRNSITAINPTLGSASALVIFSLRAGRLTTNICLHTCRSWKCHCHTKVWFLFEFGVVKTNFWPNFNFHSTLFSEAWWDPQNCFKPFSLQHIKKGGWRQIIFQFYLCFRQAVYSWFSKTCLNLIDDLDMPNKWDYVQPSTYYYFQQLEEPIKISPLQLVKARLNKFFWKKLKLINLFCHTWYWLLETRMRKENQGLSSAITHIVQIILMRINRQKYSYHWMHVCSSTRTYKSQRIWVSGSFEQDVIKAWLCICENTSHWW